MESWTELKLSTIKYKIRTDDHSIDIFQYVVLPVIVEWGFSKTKHEFINPRACSDRNFAKNTGTRPELNIFSFFSSNSKRVLNILNLGLRKDSNLLPHQMNKSFPSFFNIEIIADGSWQRGWIH